MRKRSPRDILHEYITRRNVPVNEGIIQSYISNVGLLGWASSKVVEDLHLMIFIEITA